LTDTLIQEIDYPTISHHGTVKGVTGSCHELKIDEASSVLIDCGLFQGVETAPGGAQFNRQEIDFSIAKVKALLVTHCHIDHVGRIPYLLAAGFEGSIYCSEPTAELLPLVLKDAVKIGFTQNKVLVEKFIKSLAEKIIPVPYGEWQSIALSGAKSTQLKVKFQRAGHILGSAYIECEVENSRQKKRCVFSGGLGGSFTPLLSNPKSPYQADVLVLESTYGDKNHDNREHCKNQLKKIIEHCLRNQGAVLIPAFSIGRTQELLYELEEIIFRSKQKQQDAKLNWADLEIIVDSPLANKFTEVYKKLRPYWDAEARVKINDGRHPLSFEQLTTINSHKDYLNTVADLQNQQGPVWF
jgi:metallo-beta-lactamase family protein